MCVRSLALGCHSRSRKQKNTTELQELLKHLLLRLSKDLSRTPTSSDSRPNLYHTRTAAARGRTSTPSDNMDQNTARSTASALGIGTAFFMSGIYFGSSYLAINPLLPLPISESVRIFSDLYHEGASLIIPLALGSTAANALAAYMTPLRQRRIIFAAAAVAAIGTLGYTGLAMFPNINRLLEIRGMNGSAIQGVQKLEVVHRLTVWKKQNYVRAGLAFASGVLALFATCTR